MIEILITSLLFLLFIISISILNKRVIIFSTRPSVLGIVIIISVIIQIIPGIILVSILDYPMSYGIHNSISMDTKIFTMWYTLGSLSILFLFLYISSFFINLDVNLYKYTPNRKVAYFIFFISTLIILIKVISVGEIPLFTAIGGGGELAALQKAKILRGDVGVGGFAIGYLFVYFPYVALVYLYLSKSKNILGKKIFFIYLLIISFYSIYDLQKYKFAFLMLMLLLLQTYFYGISFKKIIFVLIIIFFSLFFSFVLLGDLPLNEIFDAIAARLFIGQMEGSYMIYESLTPNIIRVMYGMPMSFAFGDDSVIDPSAEVIKIFFPEAGDAWVNSNTYILAHAWSIFGFLAVVIMPIIVSANIVAFAFFRELFSKYIGGLAASVYFVLIMTLQLNNDFSFFLYFKSIISFCILGIFSLIIIVFAKFFRIKG